MRRHEHGRNHRDESDHFRLQYVDGWKGVQVHDELRASS